MTMTFSEAEHRAWAASSPVGPLMENAIPVYNDCVNEYLEKIEGIPVKGEFKPYTNIYAWLNSFRVETNYQSGYWEYDLDDDEDIPPQEEPDDIPESEQSDTINFDYGEPPF